MGKKSKNTSEEFEKKLLDALAEKITDALIEISDIQDFLELQKKAKEWKDFD